MTRRMTAAVMRAAGDVDVFEMREVPLVWPARSDGVLVRLKAAGVNPADVWFRRLGPYVGDGKGCILGHDGSGVVEAVGPAVMHFKPGDAVCFYYGGLGAAPGTYAEYAVVPESMLAIKPATITFEQAAAFPLVFITAWESLVERACLQSGEKVLIHAGAGGTGHVAVQLARILGAKIAATVSTAEKAAMVRELGAELLIRYRETDFVEAVLDWTGRRGVDVALDNVGDRVLHRTFEASAPYGRVVTLMGLSNEIDAETAYNRNLSLHNVMMLTPQWLQLEDRLAHQGELVRKGAALLAEGRLKVHVQETFPLHRVSEAHNRLEAGGSTGKFVLTMNDS